jgi:hypothetical protein
MIYNLKKYRAINKFLTIDWNSNRYYNESIFILSGHTSLLWLTSMTKPFYNYIIPVLWQKQSEHILDLITG